MLDADKEPAGAGCCPALTGTTVKKAVLKTAAKTVTITNGTVPGTNANKIAVLLLQPSCSYFKLYFTRRRTEIHY